MAILCGAHGFVAWGGLHRLDSFGDPPQTIGSNLLHCAIHPSMVLTKQAIDCLDYQLGESRR